MKINKENILTIQGVCEYTKLAKSTIYKKISENQMPHHKIGSRTLFMVDELDHWIRNDGSMDDPIPKFKLSNMATFTVVLDKRYIRKNNTHRCCLRAIVEGKVQYIPIDYGLTQEQHARF